MSRLLDSVLTAAQREECEANDLRLARAIAPTLERTLRVDRGPASPVRGSSMDAVIAALGEGVGRVEVLDAEWDAFDREHNVDKGQKWHQVNDQHAADLQIQMQGCIGELPR